MVISNECRQLLKSLIRRWKFLNYWFRNSCYDHADRVEGDGVFDVTVCQFGAPIVLSWPHFLGAEDKFKDAVEGLNPVKVIIIFKNCF